MSLLSARKKISPKDIVLSCVCDFLFIIIIVIFFFFCGHDNFRKAQPIRTKFSHMTFDFFLYLFIYLFIYLII